LNANTERVKATLLFASILRSIYIHRNWSDLFAFFSKRYPKPPTLWDRKARKLTAPKDAAKNAFVHFKTDPSSVDLPHDLISLLETAGRTARGNMVGPDPQPCSIGPAIGAAMDGGAYMDLVYCGLPPGQYPKESRVGSQIYGKEDGKVKTMLSSLSARATTKNAGYNNRSWAEWAQLWSVIAEWVYEYDATLLEQRFVSSVKFKGSLSPEMQFKCLLGQAKVPRENLTTAAIDAADAIHGVFRQLAAKPMSFQGIEWDFLELVSDAGLREAFYSRFGRKERDPAKNLEKLATELHIPAGDAIDYSEVNPVDLKPCPDSFRGDDWIDWVLSINSGNVIVAKTLFQVSVRL
jgi:hypothetical protein